MKKFDKNYIKYHLVVDFFIILAIVAYLVFSGMEDSDSMDVAIQMSTVIGCVGLVAYALKTAYSFLYVKTSGYELKEKEIICKRGVIFRKTSVLEYSKMHAVNKKQNIIHKLFNIAVLMVDSGATHNGATAEIIIFEKDAEVDNLMAKLKALQSGKTVEGTMDSQETKEERKNLYNFTSKKMALYSALNLLSAVMVILILSSVVALSFAVLKSMLNKVFLISYKNFYLAFLMIIVCSVLGISLLSFIISFISSIFMYYDFKVYKTDTDIEISYGLLTRHVNTFKLSKIKGVKVSQGLIKRLFGYVTVNLEVIGYVNAEGNEGENANVAGVLMPFCKASELNEKLGEILPEYLPDKKQHKSVKYAPFVLFTIGFWCFFVGVAFIVAMIDLILLNVSSAIIFKVAVLVGFALALVIGWILLVNVLSYKNSGIAIGKDKITVYSGGIFRTCTVVKVDNIIGIEDRTTPLRKKAGIYSYVIHFKTNALTNEIEARNLSKDVNEKLLNLLKY